MQLQTGLHEVCEEGLRAFKYLLVVHHYNSLESTKETLGSAQDVKHKGKVSDALLSIKSLITEKHCGQSQKRARTN